MKLTKSHLHKVLATSRRGIVTLYFFDVWKLNVSKKIFDKLSAHQSVFTTKSFLDFSSAKIPVADHCVFFNPTHQAESLKDPKGRVRVSMSAIVMISYRNKSCFLIQDETIKPFGGGYQFETLPSFPTLILDNPQSKDLRFTVESHELPMVEDWYHKETNRELDPKRELREELSEENLILTPEEIKEILETV